LLRTKIIASHMTPRALLLLFLLVPSCFFAQKNSPRTPYSLDELQHRTFKFFWELADSNAQIPDRWPTVAFSSIAATGFGLSGYLVGVERGWVTRQQAAERTLKTLQVLYALPQGPDQKGMGGYKGFFYHFLDHKNARRYEDVELSSIDTGLLMGGVLSAMTYFDGDNATERDIRRLADALFRRVDWAWMLNENHRLSMGWKPEHDFLNAEWFGYTEAMLIYVMAMGSPTHPIPADSWTSWCQNYVWDTVEGQPHVNFGPLFGHQYSHVWIDFKGVQDPYMAARGIDYFENSRRATLVNHAYCRRNPGQFVGYSDKIWGLTACDGPLDWLQKNDPDHLCHRDRERGFTSYGARGYATDYRLDDGTLAPTAAGGSVPFAPEICLPTLEAMWNVYYDSLVGPYGFRDAFNPTFTACGRLPNGWFDVDYLGIDQGPILLMIENHRTGFLWNLMKRNPYIRRGMARAGFRGGWCQNLPNDRDPKAESAAPNPEVPNNPLFYFDKNVYRKSPTAVLPYRLLRPANGLKTNEIPNFSLNKKGEIRSTRSGDTTQLKLPLVVFLHGSGERGVDNEAQLRNAVLGLVEPAQFDQHPCFILAPQCPEGERWGGVSRDWSKVVFDEKNPAPAGQMVLELIDQLVAQYPAIDRHRIYITGLSMGGFGAFDLAMRRPDLFAAAMPLCGGADPAYAERIKNLPMWVIHATRDEAVMPRYSRRIVEALRQTGSDVRYTEYTTLGHAMWQEVFYNPIYTEWLFLQKKK
jgi:predicted esterase